MKTKSTLLLFFVVLIYFITPKSLFSQSFDIDAESRTRGYISHGIGQLPPKNVDAAVFIEQRTRFNFDYKMEKLQFYFGLEDKRLWGQEGNPSSGFDKNLGVYQAFINYQFAKEYSVKFGRQVIAYDNERLFTNGNWTSWGNSFDLAVLRYASAKGNTTLDIGAGASASEETAYNTIFKNDVSKYIAYAYYNTYMLDNKLELSIFSIMNGLQGRKIINDSTFFDMNSTLYVSEIIGPYVKYEDSKFQLEGEFYYSFGHTQTGKTLSGTFYGFSGTIKPFNVFEATVGYERYSGTDWSKESSRDHSTTFVNYYGEGAYFLGYLCYFVDGTSTDDAGLQDLYVDLRYSPVKKFWLEPSMHVFHLTQSYLSSGEKVDKYLGIELDFGFTYNHSDLMQLSMIGSYLWNTRTFEKIPNIGVPNAASGGTPYMFRFEALISPKIFSWKK